MPSIVKLEELEPAECIIRGITQFNKKDKFAAFRALNMGLTKLNTKKRLTFDEKILKARALTCSLKIFPDSLSKNRKTQVIIKNILKEADKKFLKHK